MKRVRMYIGFITVLILIISGCSGSGSSGTSDKYEKKVYIIGEIKDPPNGREGSAMKEEFVNRVPYDGVSTDAPIFIDAGSLMSLSETVQRGIKATYENLNPVVLILPTEADVNRLLEMLGLEKNFKMPDGFSFLNMFAVDLEKGASFRWIMLPPLNTNNNAQGDTDVAGIRVDRFSDWLSENGSRMTEKEIEERQKAVDALKSATKNGTKVNFEDYVYGYNTTINIAHTEYEIPGQNIYQLSFWIYSFHDFKTKEDWFYVRQEANLDASGLYRYEIVPLTGSYSSDKKGPYVGKYEMNNYLLLSRDLQSRYVQVPRTNPATTTDKAEVETGMDWEFSGGMGFDSIKPTGNVGLNIDIKNKKKFSIEGGQAYNKSNDNGTNTKWLYQFKEVSQSSISWSYYGFTEPSPLQKGMFSPQNNWLWRFTPDMRNLSEGDVFATKLTTHLILSNPRYITDVSPEAIRSRTQYFSKEWTNYIFLPYPPVLVVDKSINVTKSDQTKQIDIGVGRDWTASCDRPWCKVDPSSGNADTTRVNLTIDENDTHSNRKATITFKTKDGKGTAKTEVYQSKD